MGDDGVEGFAAEVFADGNKCHLGSDDALASVVELGDGPAGFGAQRSAECGVRSAECRVSVASRSVSWRNFFDIAAGENPLAAEGRQALFDFTLKSFISPRAAGVLYAHRYVDLDEPGVSVGRMEVTLAVRSTNHRVDPR